MKKVFILLSAAVLALSSCNMGEDGDAYLSIDYNEQVGEPAYVNVSYEVEYDDGRVQKVDLHNSWDWGVYYLIDRGYYTVFWEHQYKNDRNKTVRVGNEAVIEIFIDRGRTKHRDGADLYFDLILFDDNYVKFTHEKAPREKSCDLTEDGKTLLYTTQEAKGQYVMNCSVYRVYEEEVEE